MIDDVKKRRQGYSIVHDVDDVDYDGEDDEDD